MDDIVSGEEESRPVGVNVTEDIPREVVLKALIVEDKLVPDSSLYPGGGRRIIARMYERAGDELFIPSLVIVIRVKTDATGEIIQEKLVKEFYLKRSQSIEGVMVDL